ncbi:nucleotide pyrophosphohydrolase [Clostridium thermobutyricum]|jgi:NTP pyrophosphatase (non-canonical NTP hydrolase)|uniref:nucleotide pyrophosphohydrolase n=1 Tax=Clostridium thermobutyricum TaxID=29372 RepID=UPI0018A9FFB6|nr:nucleotide pyrophosphohydrolase [Clostridium thermobutyricum]
MDEIINRLIKIRDDRDWKQFHTPENLAKAINVEAGELLEHFIWDNKFDKEKVCEELADVMTYCLYMAESLEVDIVEVLNKKIDKNEKKYPIEKAKGNSKKYTEF